MACRPSDAPSFGVEAGLLRVDEGQHVLLALSQTARGREQVGRRKRKRLILGLGSFALALGLFGPFDGLCVRIEDNLGGCDERLWRST